MVSMYTGKIMEALGGSCLKLNFYGFLTLIVKRRVDKKRGRKILSKNENTS